MTTRSTGIPFDGTLYPAIEVPLIVQVGDGTSTITLGPTSATLLTESIGAAPFGSGPRQVQFQSISNDIVDLLSEDFCYCLTFDVLQAVSSASGNSFQLQIDLQGNGSNRIRLLFDGTGLSVLATSSSTGTGTTEAQGASLGPFTGAETKTIQVCGQRTSATQGIITVSQTGSIDPGPYNANLTFSTFYPTGKMKLIVTQSAFGGIDNTTEETTTLETEFQDFCLQAGQDTV